MKREEILKRKEDLVKGVDITNKEIGQIQTLLDEKIVTRNATQGAILECNFWLEQLAKADKVAAEKVVEIKKPKGDKDGKGRDISSK